MPDRWLDTSSRRENAVACYGISDRKDGMVRSTVTNRVPVSLAADQVVKIEHERDRWN